MGQKQTKVVFVGNPGCGKSTIVNTLMGKPSVLAGVSNNGFGVTNDVIELKRDDGLILIDSPGVYDVAKYRTAIKKVTNVVTKDDVRVILVTELIAGRIIDEDVKMMKELLSHMKTKLYDLILNKMDHTLTLDVNEVFAKCVGIAPSRYCTLKREKPCEDNAILSLPENVTKLEKFITDIYNY